jgi:Nuclease-related domain
VPSLAPPTRSLGSQSSYRQALDGRDIYRRHVTSSGRLIRLSRAGTCELCAAGVPAGDWAWWRPGNALVFCTACRPMDPEKEAERLAPSIADRRGLIDVGVAGRSTMREYERRRDNRQRPIRARLGRLSPLVLAVSHDPASTRAWLRGSVGETKLAASLGKIGRDDVVLLHDRRVPGTRGNIDHIVVAPTGVYVVDAKRYKGRVEVRDVSRPFRRRDLRLYVGGRDHSELARAMSRQVAAVYDALDEEDDDVGVTPVLCFIDAEWPLFGAPTEFEGVRTEGKVDSQARNPIWSPDDRRRGRGCNHAVAGFPGVPASSSSVGGAASVGSAVSGMGITRGAPSRANAAAASRDLSRFRRSLGSSCRRWNFPECRCIANGPYQSRIALVYRSEVVDQPDLEV